MGRGRRRRLLSPPLVSCIVPAFEAAAHLPGALANILEQTHRPIEVVVVDDGSSDDTVAVAAAWGDPVRVVSQPTAGPAATRNRGVAEARGDLFAFLDPDDRWVPTKLAVQVGHLERHPEVGGCVGRVRQVWVEGHEAEAERYGDHPRMVAEGVPGYATTALLVRRSAWEAVGPLDPTRWYSDATEWFVRARDAGITIDLLDEVLTEHRLHGENLTRRRPEASADEFLDLVHQHLHRRREAGRG